MQPLSVSILEVREDTVANDGEFKVSVLKGARGQLGMRQVHGGELEWSGIDDVEVIGNAVGAIGSRSREEVIHIPGNAYEASMMMRLMAKPFLSKFFGEARLGALKLFHAQKHRER